MNPLYPDIAERASFRCEYCHAPEQVFNFAFAIEHIYPLSAGSDSSSGNLALACESCNLFKSNAQTGWDGVEGVEERLYRPRRDTWEHHFAFHRETMEIRGLSPTGRATIARLKMNSPFQIRARRHWESLGFYP